MDWDVFAYRFVPDLWVITPYYNPAGYKTRRANYDIFSRLLRQSGIPLLTVECAFDDQRFDLPESVDVIRLRSGAMVWQKERLLNLATAWLPASCRYVAWLDCDLVFSNPNWARETVDLLRTHPLVQVFQTCRRLPRDTSMIGHGNVCDSFAKIVSRDPGALNSGRFLDHGHTGYGWAAQRALLDRHGLYEYAIAGSADDYMAHAALGDYESECIKRMMTGSQTLLRHYQEWARPFYESVQGSIAAVSGEVLHLWHGELKHRQYTERHLELAELHYDPYTDLVAAPGKPFELNPNSPRPGLKDWFTSYFTSRREDGEVLAVL